jgi:phosphate transport system permease protein
MIDKAILKERFVKWTLVAFALSSLLFLFLIFIFIFAEGLPLFLKVGLNKIIGGFKWAPTKGFFGIFPMIVSSFLVTIAFGIFR